MGADQITLSASAPPVINDRWSAAGRHSRRSGGATAAFPPRTPAQDWDQTVPGRAEGGVGERRSRLFPPER